MRINENFLSLCDSYLFAEVGARTAAFREAHPGRRIIDLSIGDATRPIAPVAANAMRQAAEALSHAETFRGYGNSRTCYALPGLLSAIQRDYAKKGVRVEEDEIFVSDGAKSDCGDLPELFSPSVVTLLPNPVYPAYLDANRMQGRQVCFLEGNEANGYLPMPSDGIPSALIYLCSPNNPTGAAYSVEQLKAWVAFARKSGSVILYDAAYERFVTDASARSVFQAEGARECAIEVCSFSKTAGFTGVRCGYTIVPRELKADGVSLNRLWARRQAARFNGASCIAQAGAAAVFSEEGEVQIEETLAYYRENAAMLSACLTSLGIPFTGGKNSPYLWLKCPFGMTSWEFFTYLLEGAGVVGTPGCGFGSGGEGYFRLTAFGTRETTKEACRGIAGLLRDRV